MITVDGVNVGLTLCYDVRFPELYVELAERGAQLITVHASWGTGPGKLEQWTLLARARAIDTTGFVAAVDQAYPGDETRRRRTRPVSAAAWSRRRSVRCWPRRGRTRSCSSPTSTSTRRRRPARRSRYCATAQSSRASVRQNRSGDRSLGSPDQPGPARPTAAAVPARPARRPAAAATVTAAGPAEPQKTDSSLLDKVKNLFRDPLSIVLVLVIVVALVLAGVLGGELYARSRADSIVTKATECVVQDSAKASFGVVPPFLWQHMSGHYTNINIETAGNQVRQAKGMKVNINIKDVRLEDTANASGSIGSLVANINWTADGIKQTIQDAIPLVGSFVTGVTTEPVRGHHRVAGHAGQASRPSRRSSTTGSALQVTELTGLGFTLPRETVQPALDAFTTTSDQELPARHPCRQCSGHG